MTARDLDRLELGQGGGGGGGIGALGPQRSANRGLVDARGVDLEGNPGTA
jgi:hypothetical protein